MKITHLADASSMKLKLLYPNPDRHSFSTLLIYEKNRASLTTATKKKLSVNEERNPHPQMMKYIPSLSVNLIRSG